MITSTRSLADDRTTVSVEFFIFDVNSRWPWSPDFSAPEIIAHNQAENAPTSTERTLQRAADFRFSDTRVVAHRDFDDAKSSQSAFEDHLNCPAIGGLL